MPTDVLILVATAVLAVVAMAAAAVAVRTVRRLRDLDIPPAASALDHREFEPTEARVEPEGVWGHLPLAGESRPIELQPRMVEGRVIVPPTQDQVLATVLGRPGVRANVVLYGLAHALRAENRDRIVALMRREYRQRRRERLRAGRAAARVTPIRKAS
ncbi:MAG TPA: hypothetical protein VK948_05940 [Aeromicrobium sp.]|nr:hypothetical protein [Aeromicrobium sp.]